MAVAKTAPVPRVARDRRDDRYDAGRAMPGKRAGAGWVTAVADDTVTVTILDEEVTGVVFLRDQPPVGSVVEVETRGDLLVIPRWYEHPPPSPSHETMTVDLPAHNITTVYDGPAGATIVGGPEALATRSTDTYVDMDSTTNTWGFRVGYEDGTGNPVTGFGLWTPPSGATVSDVRFVAEGYRVASGANGPFPQDDYGNAPERTSPVISTYPFLLLTMSGLSRYPTISTFPVGSVGEAVGQGTGFSPESVNMRPAVSMATYPYPVVPMGLRVTYLAVRITYEVAA
jgi:hypothetical protein